MTYQDRDSSSSLERPEVSSRLSQFDRFIAICTLISTTFVGIATAVIAYIGLQITYETGSWERRFNLRSESAQSEQEKIEAIRYNREQCLKHASMAVDKTHGKSEIRALEIIKNLENTMGSPCHSAGIGLAEMTAALVIRKFPNSESGTAKAAQKIIKNPELFGERTKYNPAQLAYDQSSLRQYYMKDGYADFTVVSAVEELRNDRKDFIISNDIQNQQLAVGAN